MCEKHIENTLEHIGLGRYGDKLDPDGWSKALASLAQLLQPQGILLLSVPIGIQRVHREADLVSQQQQAHIARHHKRTDTDAVLIGRF